LVAKLSLPRIQVKYHIRLEEIEALVALIVLQGEKVNTDMEVKVCRDPKDDMFIEAALAGEAQVVGDGRRRPC